MDTQGSPIDIPPTPRRRGGRRPGAGRPRGSQNKASKGIREFLQSRTGEHSEFREHLDRLLRSPRIFEPQYRWLVPLVLEYGYGRPKPMEEQEAPRQQVIFLSMNPIGDDRFDPLAGAKPVGPRELLAPAPEPEPAGSFRGLDGQERDPSQEPQPFSMRDEALRPRRADYR
jgi:hypothetical protein